MIPRLLDIVQRLIANAVRVTVFHVPVRYRVIETAADGRLRLQAVARGKGYPDTLPLSIWPGLPGAVKPTAGAQVLVSFIEGDPTLPVVTHFQVGPAFVPVSIAIDVTDTLTLGASATEINAGKALGAVVREGDTITVGTASGPVVISVGLGVPPEKSRLKA